MQSLPEAPIRLTSSAFLKTRRLALILAASSIFFAWRSGAGQASQGITAVSGFRRAAENDPFAKKDVLDVTSASFPIAGMAGARATVEVFCYSHKSFLSGKPESTKLRIEVAVTGTNLDIVTSSNTHTTYNFGAPNTEYATQDRTVNLKVRFDDNDTVFRDEPATDTHHVSFDGDLAEVAAARRLLVGLSANGRSINLSLNLHEAALADIVKECGESEVDRVKKNDNDEIDRKRKEKEDNEADLRNLAGMLTRWQPDDFQHRFLDGSNLNAPDGEGNTALILGAKADFQYAVKELLAHGADVNAVNHAGVSALVAARNNGHADMVRMLLSYGALDVKPKDPPPDASPTPPGAASSRSAPSGTSPKASGPSGPNVGQKDLVAASAEGNLVKVQMLLANGVAPDGPDEQGKTALESAIENGRLEVARALAAKGASLNEEPGSGVTPLLVATLYNKLDILQWLLADGADVNKPGLQQTTPLMAAVSQNNQAAAQILLGKGANINAKAINGITPLMVASQQGNAEMVKMLLAKGADVNAHTDNGEVTALSTATKFSHEDIRRLLLAAGAK